MISVAKIPHDGRPSYVQDQEADIQHINEIDFNKNINIELNKNYELPR